MDQNEALRIAREATSNALEAAGDDPVKAEELLQHTRMMNPQVDQAFDVVGRTLLEAEQAKKH